MSTEVNVYIVYYSLYGHIRTLAEAEKKGIERVPGVKCTLYQVAETLPAEVIEKMHGAPKADHPTITADELTKADGVLFGIPTRFGMCPAQIKAFMDSTGSAWGKLVGIPAGTFFSTGSQGGGQETTALTFVTQLAHHAMVYVPLGFTQPGQRKDELHGGSAYGAGTYAGADGSKKPTELELEIATGQGEMFAKTALALKQGRAAAGAAAVRAPSAKK